MPRYRNGPGGTITVSEQYAYTKTSTFTTSPEAGFSILDALFSAKSSVSSTITRTTTKTLTHTYSKEIAPGKWGNLQYYVSGWDIKWHRMYKGPNCNVRTLDGRAHLRVTDPKKGVGWWYRETDR